MQRLEQFVAKPWQDDALDQLLAQLSTAAMGQDDLLVIGDRQRARAQQRGRAAI